MTQRHTQPTSSADPGHDSLTSDILQSYLTTRCFGRVLHVLEHTTSTNDIAKNLAQAGAPDGTVILAEHQSQGRGRQGRRFVSPPGGIYLSLILRPQLAPERLPQLTLVVAVAVAEALTELCALPVGLKWPNDVEIHGKKVAGILTEAVFTGHDLPVVIIGVGINVNTTLEQWPETLRPRVTSLAIAAGHPWQRAPLIGRCLSGLESLYYLFRAAGCAPIVERWLMFECSVGRRVRFVYQQRTFSGVVSGLDSDGALLVQSPEYAQLRLTSGEVIFE